jgi:hypothetical protein
VTEYLFHKDLILSVKAALGDGQCLEAFRSLTPTPDMLGQKHDVKGRSSRRLQDEFPELRKRYWGQHLWARGYFCARVGAVDEGTIREYIENQKWDQGDQGVKINAPAKPSAP